MRVTFQWVSMVRFAPPSKPVTRPVLGGFDRRDRVIDRGLGEIFRAMVATDNKRRLIEKKDKGEMNVLTKT